MKRRDSDSVLGKVDGGPSNANDRRSLTQPASTLTVKKTPVADDQRNASLQRLLDDVARQAQDVTALRSSLKKDRSVTPGNEVGVQLL